MSSTAYVVALVVYLALFASIFVIPEPWAWLWRRISWPARWLTDRLDLYRRMNRWLP